jgi:hypothetical protein
MEETTVIYWVWELNREGTDNPDDLFSPEYYGIDMLAACAAVSKLRQEGKSCQMNTTTTQVWLNNKES